MEPIEASTKGCACEALLRLSPNKEPNGNITTKTRNNHQAEARAKLDHPSSKPRAKLADPLWANTAIKMTTVNATEVEIPKAAPINKE